jgi:hypothetical protein
LVFLDKNGDLAHKDGRELVSNHGASGFPFTQERIDALKKEEADKKAELVETVAAKGVLAALFGDKAPVLKQKPTEALVVYQADGGAGSTVHVVPKLVSIFILTPSSHKYIHKYIAISTS